MFWISSSCLPRLVSLIFAVLNKRFKNGLR
jgi:hypothetical protein